mmetsp:Transcript_89168/g.247622  ORF Transcript_89168/g.247622 Transcript_89168/m.247622 type:complete len:213 (-) Transcript_89168:888-1526(-)
MAERLELFQVMPVHHSGQPWRHGQRGHTMLPTSAETYPVREGPQLTSTSFVCRRQQQLICSTASSCLPGRLRRLETTATRLRQHVKFRIAVGLCLPTVSVPIFRSSPGTGARRRAGRRDAARRVDGRAVGARPLGATGRAGDTAGTRPSGASQARAAPGPGRAAAAARGAARRVTAAVSTAGPFAANARAAHPANPKAAHPAGASSAGRPGA